MAKWLARNLVNLIIVGLIAVGLFYFFKDIPTEELFTSARNLVLVVVGLGLVIFIHELGHFLAAKACDVKVEVFSLGFGRAIPGCSFRRGETEYKLAVFPLGGYVKMLGENPGEKAEGEEGGEGEPVEIADDPRAFPNKTVGQRMIIISAGVIMNVILGLVCFIYVYHNGKTEVAARLGGIEPGSPADRKGVRAGSELLQVNNDEQPNFEALFFASAFSTPGESEILLKWRTPDGLVQERRVTTIKKPDDLKPSLGIAFPHGLLVNKGVRDGHKPEFEGIPAARAGFKARDRLIAVAGEDEANFRPLKSGWDLAQAEHDFRGQPVRFKVLRGKASPEEVVVAVPPLHFRALGLIMQMGPVVAIGADAPKELQGVRENDVIVAIDGDEQFDPLRLPDLVMDRARQASDGQVELTFRRPDVAEPMVVKVKPDLSRGTWSEESPIGYSSPVSIPALGLAYSVKTTVARVPPDSPALGKIRPGDVIREVILPPVGETKEGRRKLESDFWPQLFWSLQFRAAKTVRLVVTRDGAELPEPVELSLTADSTWPLPSRGMDLIVERETQTIHADGALHAMQLGLRDTYRTIGNIYLNLRGLLVGNVSVKLLHGPISIPKMAYGMADRSFTDLMLFLGMISINLAVVNFLPIPVLDGGHMMFLIVEKIRGKPASDRILIIANTIGLVLLVSLMAFVLFLDVQRLFS